MKSVLNSTDREAIIARIQSLQEHQPAVWGKMNVSQMMEHCRRAEETFLGIKVYPRSFLGRIIGPMALRQILKDDRSFGRNAPTADQYKITGDYDFITVQQQWIELIRSYSSWNKPFIVHWFFGKMTTEQVGIFAWKHTDHHLRQFNT
jgi:hypothetical protein